MDGATIQQLVLINIFKMPSARQPLLAGCKGPTCMAVQHGWLMVARSECWAVG
jgi:hypothetical protein